MKHIIIVHSNICSLVVYQTIEQLLAAGKEVVILTDRNAHYLFGNDRVTQIDLSSRYNNLRIFKAKSIAEVIKKRLYRYKIKRYLDTVIKVPFVLYIPNMALDYATAFMENPYLKGYYFFEEGTLSYLSLDKVQVLFPSNGMRYRLKRCLGLAHYFPFERTPLFKGVICLNEKAFPWCETKIINNLSLPESGKSFVNQEPFEHIIVFNYLPKELEVVTKELQWTMHYLEEHGVEKCAIKFHPHSYFYEKEKVDSILGAVGKEKLTFNTLQPDYCVEYELMRSKCRVYAVDTVSSLLLYSTLLNGSSVLVYSSEVKIKLVRLDSVEQVLQHIV